MLESHAGDAQVLETALVEPSSGSRASVRVALSHGLQVQQVDALDLVVVSKRVAGLDVAQVRVLTDLVRDIAAGHLGPCKFLVFDLAAQGGASGRPPPLFEAFLEDLSDLIFQVPVISIAWARHDVSGPDLDLALACSMLVGEDEARLVFDMDLIDSLRAYSLLAHKIGFVQAERLMENAAVLSAAAAHDLMLLHSVVPSGEGAEGIRRFVGGRTRRHNSACGIYRAQRIAMLGVG